MINKKFHKFSADILQLIYGERQTNTVKVMVIHLKRSVLNTAVINRKIHHIIVTCLDDV
jgi:hypothetical protein